ncbi:oleate hydratase [Phaeobacter sp. SYSU ZJ3003]|uniref:oleate hydratase n=1 Tax=Phaeobacter sp. SYSU ZJ3003 TaxID=2109330 RepID=UPI00351C2A9A
MPEDATKSQHHIVGGGIAGLSAAVFLCRDAGVHGEDICIYEQLGIVGGSLDGAGDAETGYLVRGGRMFEEHFACTFDLLESIPLTSDPAKSAKDGLCPGNWCNFVLRP